jgi:5-oxopent-3-ene-1,2,5-tricarboxylate decarboxylase/2-hydroxyhepta-2,4-diene-1,7-dioate isomerase
MQAGQTIAIAPYAPLRLTGTVYGTLVNHPDTLAALGDAVHQVPYKAPPKAPVLYVKPRNTFIADGAAALLPPGVAALEAGVALAIVVGRTACRLSLAEALAAVAGYAAALDFCVPHSSFYRPSVRLRAIDRSFALGPVVDAREVPDPDALSTTLEIDGRTVQTGSTAGMLRSVARLLVDVTEFMTLQPGDVLLHGLQPGAPLLRAGQTVAVEIEGLPPLRLPQAQADEVTA